MLVTHSEVILDEALDHNLTLLLAGRADDVKAKTSITECAQALRRGALHPSGANCGCVQYVEVGTDIEILLIPGLPDRSPRRGRVGRTDQLVLRWRTIIPIPAWIPSWPCV